MLILVKVLKNIGYIDRSPCSKLGVYIFKSFLYKNGNELEEYG